MSIHAFHPAPNRTEPASPEAANPPDSPSASCLELAGPSWVYEPESGRILDANEAAIRLCGVCRHDLRSRTISQVLRLRDIPQTCGTRISGRHTVQRPNGLVVHLNIVDMPVVVSGRPAVRATAVWHDFFEAADQRLTLLKRCVDRIEDVVLLLEATAGSDKPPLITYANRACEARSGFSRAQLLDAIPPTFLDPVELASALAQALRVAGAGAGARVELKCRSSEGEVFLVDVEMLEPTRDYPGRWAWVATGRDKREVERELRERKEELSGIVETAMDAIITVDQQRRIQLFNRAAAAMFGISADEARGELIERFVPHRAQRSHVDHVSKFAESGTTVRKMGGLLHVLTGLRSNGEEFPIEASISKMDHAGSALMTVVIRDVTELRRAEESRRAQLLAEGSNRAKTAFLSRMSHELRTPLNAVLGFAQVLASNDTEPPSSWQLDQLKQICTGGWHLLALIDDVLDVTQIEAGKLRLNSESVTLTEILDNSISMLGAKAEHHRVTLHANYASGGSCVVKGDPIRIRQVVLNVLSNAVKYNVAGGKVVVTASHRDGKVSLTVSDTGIGMSAEQLEHLFEPFNRLGRASGSIEGTGIGLYLSRQLVELMGGEMSVTSVLGGGTQVLVTIPAANTAVESRTERTAATNKCVRELLQGPVFGTVLYVEDNDVNYLLVEQMLQRWPRVTLKRAHTVAEAVQLVNAIEPDITLLDMQLPDGTGLDVLQALRSAQRTRCHPVVALSASAMPDEVTTALRAGANDYWTKPLDYDAFVYDMAVLLENAHAR